MKTIKQITLFIACLLIAVDVFGQVDQTLEKGIHFEENLSWKQIQAKARAENKFIFMDCYATWCGPCKWMDKNVYPDSAVGNHMNKQFISVRVQMDQTTQDNGHIKSWYADAQRLKARYHINAYPGFYFFTSNAKLQYIDAGARSVEEFIRMADSVKSSHTHFYALLTDYQLGNKNYRQLPQLIDEAGRLGQDSMAKVMAKDYFVYLNSLAEENLWNKENIALMTKYTHQMDFNGRLFRLIFKNKSKVDSVFNGNDLNYDIIMLRVIVGQILSPIVERALKNKTEPDWDQLIVTLEKEYNRYQARRSVFYARSQFYFLTKNWEKYASSQIDEAEERPNLQNEPGPLNNFAAAVFDYSSNPKHLELALQWAKRSVSFNPKIAAHIDTEANLLYKLGKKEDAIKLEQEASSLNPKDKLIIDALNKMQQSKPPWKFPEVQIK